MRRVVLLSLILLLAGFANAETLVLHTENDVPLEGLLAKVRGAEGTTTHIVGPDNTIDVSQEGKLTIQVIDAAIFVGHYETGTGGNLLLRPTAKLSGRVVDNQDNLLQHKDIRVICSGGTSEPLPSRTDEFGFFTIEEVGFGICEVTAIVDDKAYTQSLTVMESKHYITTIETESSIELPSGTTWKIILFAILVAIVIAFLVLKKAIRNENREKMSPKQEAVLDTLSEREKEIVNLLFFDGNLTQSQLRHQTGMPKSSLFRTLSGLRRKGLVLEMDESGVKKFVLSDTFRR